MNENTVRKLQSNLKLCGFLVRREFCNYILEKFNEAHTDLSSTTNFEQCLRNLCECLENQNISEHSIEKEHIEKAVDFCLNSGYNKNETIFNVINAFDFPRLGYDADRKQFFLESNRPKVFAEGNAKTQMFLERYSTILQRTNRNFKNKLSKTEYKLELQTVDFLLTSSQIELKTTLILGSLLEVNDGNFYLEDPSGIVKLDLSQVEFHNGFYVENSFVLVNGYYEDKVLKVKSIMLPPGEEYADSRPSFGILNYFGGSASTCLRDSVRLREHLMNNQEELMVFFSDVWLDHPEIFNKLETLFTGFDSKPPIAFIFMGSFLSRSYGSTARKLLKGLFKRLAELIRLYPSLMHQSEFVFVPAGEDPCASDLLPRLPLSKLVTEDLNKTFNKAIFASNPCRIQYCNKEIVVFRSDISTKLLRCSLHKPTLENRAEYMAKTIISQGHLSPLSLTTQTVHWDFDYTLRLFPLPNIVVIGDRCEPYQHKYKGCQIINPGSLCTSGFRFKSYVPSIDAIDECEL